MGQGGAWWGMVENEAEWAVATRLSRAMSIYEPFMDFSI